MYYCLAEVNKGHDLYLLLQQLFQHPANVSLNNFEDLTILYCNEGKHISLRIHFAHHHHMLPSCNPVVHLTFFTSAAACGARGLGRVAQGSGAFGDQSPNTVKGNRAPS